MPQTSGKRYTPIGIAMNTARLSMRVCNLFPPGVVAAELREYGDPSQLLPEEAQYLGRAVAKRVQEFAAGRMCARRALAELGIANFPIKVADDRQPIWPDGTVGSITHTDGFCAAVVAERRRMSALGLDSEVVADVNAQIWPSICVPIEAEWVRSLPVSEQASAVALIFSAKEAFYKCQYPVAREPLNFDDVSIEAVAWGAAEGVFEIRPIRDIAIARSASLPMQGRYVFHGEFVTAGMGFPAAAESAQ
jgi:4'-phosphopantetheinyl transferase EntD